MRRSRRVILNDSQIKLVYAASQLLSPDLRYHFILCVARQLKLNDVGMITNERLQASITQALDEVAA